VGEVLSIGDFILTPMYMLIIYLIAYQIKAKQIIKHPEYKYFVKGLSFKLFGATAFVLIYIFYYGGGDTINYFKSTVALSNLFFEDFDAAFSILTGDLSPKNYSKFNYNTGYPSYYMWKDPATFTVVRYALFFLFLGGKSIFTTSFFTACFSYIGIWKLFQLFVKIYPKYIQPLSIAILFIPSFVFWGSGIMKDTFVVGAACWITANFYAVFIQRKKLLLNILLLGLNFYIIVNLKPYLIISLLPGMLFWLNRAYLNKIKNTLIQLLVLPLLIGSLSLIGFFLVENIGDLLGKYGNVDDIVKTAQITQEDLLRAESYGSNSYDLGEIDGSFSGLLGKAPMSIFTAIYRPSIIEIGSPTMVLSAIENTVLLFLTLLLLLRTKLSLLYRLIKDNSLVLYSLIFTVILAFGTGLATANFGALVRYKIPLIPFYFSSLVILNEMRKERKQH
jgi:hypothetical protein